MDKKDEHIKFLIELNEKQVKEIIKLEKEINDLKKLIALKEEYK